MKRLAIAAITSIVCLTAQASPICDLVGKFARVTATAMRSGTSQAEMQAIVDAQSSTEDLRKSMTAVVGLVYALGATPDVSEQVIRNACNR